MKTDNGLRPRAWRYGIGSQNQAGGTFLWGIAAENANGGTLDVFLMPGFSFPMLGGREIRGRSGCLLSRCHRGRRRLRGRDFFRRCRIQRLLVLGTGHFLEYAITHYFGPDGDMLGFNNLNSVGAGMELDIGKWERIISRLRLMGRYRFGQNVSGYSVSLGISF